MPQRQSLFQPKYHQHWLDDVQITKNQVRLCLDAQFDFTALQLLEKSSGPPEFLLLWKIGISDRTKKYILVIVFLRLLYLRPELHIKELTPRFGMISETLHKTGIAILAAMSASNVRICGIITDRQIGFCQYARRIYRVYADAHFIDLQSKQKSPLLDNLDPYRKREISSWFSDEVYLNCHWKYMSASWMPAQPRVPRHLPALASCFIFTQHCMLL